MKQGRILVIRTSAIPCLFSDLAKNSKIMCVFVLFLRRFGHFESLAFSFQKWRDEPYAPKQSNRIFLGKSHFFTTMDDSCNWIEIHKNNPPPPTNVTKISVPSFKKEENFMPSPSPSFYSINQC